MAYAKIIKALLSGEEFVVYGDGEQKRSNTYIDDIVDATLLAEGHAKAGDILNVCGDDTISLNEAISIMEELSGLRLNKIMKEVRIGDQQDTSGINQLAKDRLGWSAQVNLRNGLRQQLIAAGLIKSRP